MQRDRVVDERAHPPLPERGHEGVAPRVAHHEEVEDRAGVGLLAERLDPRALELPSVEGREGPAPLGPGGEVPEPYPQEGGLQLVEAAVHARDLVPVPVALPAVAQLPQPGREAGVVHEDRPAVAEGAEVLGRVEGKRADAALAGERPHRPALVARAVRLARVLEDGEAPLAGEGQDRAHVRGVAVEVDGDDGLRARGDRPGGRLRVEVQRARVHVHEDGPGARLQHGEAGEGGRRSRW